MNTGMPTLKSLLEFLNSIEGVLEREEELSFQDLLSIKTEISQSKSQILLMKEVHSLNYQHLV
jgi:hypothetical protein